MPKKHIDLINSTHNWILDETTKSIIINMTRRRKEVIKGDINVEELIHEYKKNPREEIMEMIILYNLPMAVVLVKSYAHLVDEINIPDLFSTAMETIIKSVEKYDINRNNKFSSYLVINMHGEILKAIDQMRIVKFTYYHHMVKSKASKNENISDEIPVTADIEDTDWPVKIITESDIAGIMDGNQSIEVMENYIHHKSPEAFVEFYKVYESEKKNEIIRENLYKCYEDFVKTYCIKSYEKSFSDYLFECMMNNVRRPMIIKKYREYNITKRQAYGISYKMNIYIKTCLQEKAVNYPELMEIINEVLYNE